MNNKNTPRIDELTLRRLSERRREKLGTCLGLSRDEVDRIFSGDNPGDALIQVALARGRLGLFIQRFLPKIPHTYQYEDRMFRTVMEGARGLARECLVQHEIKEPDSHIGDIFKEMAESGWSVASGTYGGALKVASHFLYEVTGTGKSAIMDKMLEHNGAMSHDLKVYCLENFVPLEERGLSLTLEEGDPMDGTTVESWCLNKLFMGRTRPTNSIDNEGEPNGFSASNVHRLFPCTP